MEQPQTVHEDGSSESSSRYPFDKGMSDHAAPKHMIGSSEDTYASWSEKDLVTEITRLEKTVEWMHDLIWKLIQKNQTMSVSEKYHS